MHLFSWKSELRGEGKTSRYRFSTLVFTPQMTSTLGLGQMETGDWELPLGFLHGWLGPLSFFSAFSRTLSAHRVRSVVTWTQTDGCMGWRPQRFRFHSLHHNDSPWTVHLWAIDFMLYEIEKEKNKDSGSKQSFKKFVSGWFCKWSPRLRYLYWSSLLLAGSVWAPPHY